MNANLEAALRGTDWAMFRQQKTVLIEASDTYPELEGLLNWCDALQDAVVADGLIASVEVFHGRSF